MNRYTYDELEVGQKEDFSVEITEEMMSAFKNITGDINLLHCDEAFAKEHGYGQRVVYGLLSTSFLSTLAGVYLPGERSLIQEVSVKYVKPVFVGDRLTVLGEVTDMHDAFHRITVKVLIVNQDGIKVLKGKMQIGVMD